MVCDGGARSMMKRKRAEGFFAGSSLSTRSVSPRLCTVIFERDLAFGVEGRRPQLLRHHLAQTLEALDLRPRVLGSLGQCLFLF